MVTLLARSKPGHGYVCENRRLSVISNSCSSTPGGILFYATKITSKPRLSQKGGTVLDHEIEDRGFLQRLLQTRRRKITDY